ncbi:DUF4166 domain-containing protein [Glaciihabitans sp. dw_435]|uniref:DUF4166 domain-containing protein n=1 Tax=Glaciihabitans sp. dw_435 TaxID=2720081 RepID=UPI001BD69C00|nr:DUF4166 domain-containing protein [Glaciihabitans sp. dw_435]
MTDSVYQRVLGDDFAALAPELRSYFERPPAGSVGVGTGVYEVAGSRHRWLRPVFTYLAWRHILFPEYGTAIPFEVLNVPGPGDGLSARRLFQFAGRTRIMEDTMHVIDGRLHDFLGRRRGLEVRLRVRIVDGALAMQSDGVWLHLRRLRLPVPAVLSARVTLTECWDGDAQHVSVRMRNPLLGEIFEYRGSFTFRHALTDEDATNRS